MWLYPLQRRTVNTLPVLMSLTLNTAPLGIFFDPPLNQSRRSVFPPESEEDDEDEEAFFAPELFILLSVLELTLPVTDRPFRFWKALTAVFVPFP